VPVLVSGEAIIFYMFDKDADCMIQSLEVILNAKNRIDFSLQMRSNKILVVFHIED